MTPPLGQYNTKAYGTITDITGKIKAIDARLPNADYFYVEKD